MRSLAKVILSLAAVSLGCAFGSASVAGEKEALHPTVFPAGKQLVPLGKLDAPTADWAWVKAPQSVVDAAKAILEGHPNEWDVNNAFDYPVPGKDVVILSDRRNKCLVFLAKKDRWIRLNDRGGISSINDLLRNLPGRDVRASRMDDRVKFARYIASLYRGPCRMVLSDYFLNNIAGAKAGAGKPWLNGKEKRPEALYELCGDPVSTRDGNSVKFTFNVMILGGGVEAWTVSGTWANGLAIRTIDVKLIRDLGTFEYGCD